MDPASTDGHPLQTRHRLHFGDARRMTAIGDRSIDLVVTSPPYPMIQMWDELFARLDPAVARALLKNDGRQAFERMHATLDPVWSEVYRVVKPGGIVCINIGDAVRTIGGDFALYPNHARILSAMIALGFQPLPLILWRKPTNAPNKFMGSGMLPPGAYVTLEHEHILILRKGAKRDFSGSKEKRRRHESAYFWEERNTWFSDVWMGLIGASQRLVDNDIRKRNAAFPLELPYRLISMFSVAGDRVLDPFLGIGTTLLAAMATGRNAIGFELESEFRQTIAQSLTAGVPIAHRRIAERIANHLKFLQERIAAGRTIKHRNHFYGFPVMTRQEVNLAFHRPIAVSQPGEDMFAVDYDLFTMKDNPLPQSPPAGPRPSSPTTGHPQQGLLFE
ncbi:MAG: site-specific DNA-methyltransferase [Desulfobacterales bacterium]